MAIFSLIKVRVGRSPRERRRQQPLDSNSSASLITQLRLDPRLPTTSSVYRVETTAKHSSSIGWLDSAQRRTDLLCGTCGTLRR
jgi:hypothetical protein